MYLYILYLIIYCLSQAYIISLLLTLQYSYSLIIRLYLNIRLNYLDTLYRTINLKFSLKM